MEKYFIYFFVTFLIYCFINRMKKAKVFHAYPPNFDCEDVPMSNYKEIAEVDLSMDVEDSATIDIALDYVYSISQNVTTNWIENIGVKGLNGNKHSRSTSTGDIVEVDGKKYRCEWIGWKRLLPS